jgi:diacylglycerol kinase (ATP)
MANFTIAARIKSITYALAGIATMLRTQHNAWVHLAATVAVVLLAFWFAISVTEWLALILAIIAVWSAEALNTAFELLCDVASPEFHPLVKQAKDVAAAAVLIAAVGAAAVGLLIFGPRLIALL